MAVVRSLWLFQALGWIFCYFEKAQIVFKTLLGEAQVSASTNTAAICCRKDRFRFVCKEGERGALDCRRLFGDFGEMNAAISARLSTAAILWPKGLTVGFENAFGSSIKRASCSRRPRSVQCSHTFGSRTNIWFGHKYSLDSSLLWHCFSHVWRIICEGNQWRRSPVLHKCVKKKCQALFVGRRGVAAIYGFEKKHVKWVDSSKTDVSRSVRSFARLCCSVDSFRLSK